MLINIAILFAGLLLVVFGADFLVDGASAIARRLHVSEFVIGLTIVGFGTSCPELVVSLTGAIGGHSDISAGNVIGSNIFNTLLILGLTALIMPIGITRENRRRDIPVTLLVTILFAVCGMSKTLFAIGEYDGLSRIEGIVFLLLFAVYIYSCFRNDNKSAETNSGDSNSPAERSVGIAILLTLGGLAGLVLGGHWFVNSAVKIAEALGVSDKFIAITLLAGGTSLPELATCVVAAAKKKGQLALGNILGSNIFNILLILGCASVVTPLHFSGINLVDIIALLSSMVLLTLTSYTFEKNRIDRFEGAVFLAAFIAYYVWLFVNL